MVESIRSRRIAIEERLRLRERLIRIARQDCARHRAWVSSRRASLSACASAHQRERRGKTARRSGRIVRAQCGNTLQAQRRRGPRIELREPVRHLARTEWIVDTRQLRLEFGELRVRAARRVRHDDAILLGGARDVVQCEGGLCGRTMRLQGTRLETDPALCDDGGERGLQGLVGDFGRTLQKLRIRFLGSGGILKRRHPRLVAGKRDLPRHGIKYLGRLNRIGFDLADACGTNGGGARHGGSCKA